MRGGPAGPGERKAPWPVGAAERQASTWGKCLFLPQAQSGQPVPAQDPRGSRCDVGKLRPKADTRGPCAVTGRGAGHIPQGWRPG